MADMGQDKESLGIKHSETEIRILQKKNTLANIEVERKVATLNIRRLEKKLKDFDSQEEELKKQITIEQKDLASIAEAINK